MNRPARTSVLTICVAGLAAYLAAQPVTDEAYVDQPFSDDFEGQSVDNDVWQVATWSEHGGQTGRERCFVDSGYLHMVFINSSTDGYLSAAIQTRDEFWYGTWEARIKPTHVPGVLNSFYTIDWNNTADASSSDNGTKEEIDIEFLTNSFSGTAGEVHYALHKSGETSFQTNPDVSLDFDPSADFHVFGFRVTPERVEWTVDDSVMQSYTYAGNPITVTSPYQLKLNVWSAEHWIGGPPAPDVECTYLIDWIRFTPYPDNEANPSRRSRSTAPGRVRYDQARGGLVIAGGSDAAARIALYDAAGLRVHRWHAERGVEALAIPGSVAPGLHVVEVRSGAGVCTERISLCR